MERDLRGGVGVKRGFLRHAIRLVCRIWGLGVHCDNGDGDDYRRGGRGVSGSRPTVRVLVAGRDRRQGFSNGFLDVT